MMQDRLRPVPESGDAATPSEAAQPKRQRAPQRPRAARALPTDRMKLDLQKLALKAVATESQYGRDAVSSDQIANRLSIAPATAGLNNAFFVEAGLLTREGKGRWKPTDATVEFARKHSFDPERAGEALGGPLAGSWYFREVSQHMQVVETTTVDQIIEALARAAGADASHRVQLATILQWLEYARLIDTTSGRVVLVGDVAPPPLRAPPEGDERKPPADAPAEGATEPQGRSQRSPAEPILTFSFDCALTADDLAHLTPEQIRAVFEAVGQVAAVRASLRS